MMGAGAVGGRRRRDTGRGGGRRGWTRRDTRWREKRARRQRGLGARLVERLEALERLEEDLQLGLADVLVVRRRVLGLLAREAVHARKQPLEVGQLAQHRLQHLAHLPEVGAGVGRRGAGLR